MNVWYCVCAYNKPYLYLSNTISNIQEILLKKYPDAKFGFASDCNSPHIDPFASRLTINYNLFDEDLLYDSDPRENLALSYIYLTHELRNSNEEILLVLLMADLSDFELELSTIGYELSELKKKAGNKMKVLLLMDKMENKFNGSDIFENLADYQGEIALNMI